MRADKDAAKADRAVDAATDETTAQPAGRSRARTVFLAIYGVVAAVVIASAVAMSAASDAGGSDSRTNLTIIAPAGAGGGWDTFAREAQQSMRADSIVNQVQVVNIPGAGGTIGLSKVSTMTGQTGTILATGAAMTGGIVLNNSPVDFSDTRPIARVAEDFNVITVPADAPYETLDEFVEAWREDPGGFPLTGGSAGSIDHLIFADLGIEAGIDAADITFIPRAGGGEAVQTMVSGTARAAATGYNEISDQIEAGRVRALGISSPERLDGIDVPTLVEQGYDTQLTNWRGFLAPPGITDEQLAELDEIIAELVESEGWADALERNRWEDSYLRGEEFEEFLDEDIARTTELLEELGL